MFGTLEDGRRIDALTLGEPHGLQAEVLTYGAILRRLSFPVRGQRRNLILGFDRLEDYVRDRAYVGALVGRFGNRIANARFSLDGRERAVTANESSKVARFNRFVTRTATVIAPSFDRTPAPALTIE